MEHKLLLGKKIIKINFKKRRSGSFEDLILLEPKGNQLFSGTHAFPNQLSCQVGAQSAAEALLGRQLLQALTHWAAKGPVTPLGFSPALNIRLSKVILVKIFSIFFTYR